jgi:stage II sporulation protein D
MIGRRGISAWMLVVMLTLPLHGLAESKSVRVRLFSLHPEHRLKLTATSGSLFWKTCEQCEERNAFELDVEANAELGSNRLLVRGNYRLSPENGLGFSAAFPLELKNGSHVLSVVGIVPLEDYVAAAVAGESGSFKNVESLKAMAVAVRSYASHFGARHEIEGYDFCDSTHCQALNFQRIGAQARAAANSTRGELLWFDGVVAATFYHQNCGGAIADASEAWPAIHEPYLKQHADSYCIRATPLPWRAQFDCEKLGAALRQQGLNVPEHWDMLEIVSRSSSGRALKLAFHQGTRPPQMISASSLRFAIGRAFGWNQVRSDLYETSTAGDAVIFNGRGAGHGIGLCQAGAEEMAREGKSYRQILAFYYPGTAVAGDAKTPAWQKLERGRMLLLTTQPDQDSDVLRLGEFLLSSLESELGWKLQSKVQFKVYPSIDAYRDFAGQPGWIAAFTRGHTISLQPLAILKQKSILESTLRHELTHLLLESRAHAPTPLWFREGLVLYFANPNSSAIQGPVNMRDAEIEAALQHPEDRQSVERAYTAARARVAQLINGNGRDTVLQWLSTGLENER